MKRYPDKVDIDVDKVHVLKFPVIIPGKIQYEREIRLDGSGFF